MRRVAGWELWSEPRSVIVYVLCVHALTALAWLGAILSREPQAGDWVVLGVCTLGLVGFAAAVSRSGRAHSHAHGVITADSAGVWIFAIAVLVEPALAIPAILVLHPLLCEGLANKLVAHTRRESGGVAAIAAHKRAFNASMFALVGVCTHQVYDTIIDHTTGAFSLALALVGAIGIYLLTNAVVLSGVVALALNRPLGAILRGQARSLSVQGPVLACGALMVLTWETAPVAVVLVFPLAGALQRSAQHQGLLATARLDAKTGLTNAGTWKREAEEALSRALAAGDELAVAVFDLDHFKQVNDTHGHLVGDEVLIEVSSRLRESVGSRGALGRFGGEEFVLLLERTGADEALALAESCRAALAATPIATAAGPLPVRASVGVASLTSIETGLHQVLERADAALYEAKAGGRNQVRVSIESVAA